MKEITPQELYHLLKASSDTLLLDVREQHEFEAGHLIQSQHMPMAQVPQSHTSLDLKQNIVVICLHGIRSRMVCSYLEQMNFENIVNLTGGIDAWRKQIPPEQDAFYQALPPAT